MSESARTEAERIVYEEVEQRYRTERLVAVIATAIEEMDAEDNVEALRNSPRQHGKVAATMRLANARDARREELSALRGA